MQRTISIMLVLFFMVALIPSAFAQTDGESKGCYVADRGIIGVVYGTVVVVAKTVEAVIFGKYGLAGLKDYFHLNEVFQEQSPRY